MRDLASPFLKRGGYRFRTTVAEQSSKRPFNYRPFWNSGRVLLFSAATGTTTYFYGANDETTRFPVPWRRTPGPQYANKYEMETASSPYRKQHQTTECLHRQSKSSGKSWETMPSVPTTKISIAMATRMVLNQHRPAPSGGCIPQINSGGLQARQNLLQVQNTHE